MIIEKPNHSYSHGDEAWLRYIYALAATYALPRRDVAAKCDVKLANWDNHPLTILAWSAGQADFKAGVWERMNRTAQADPSSYEDPQERSQVRALAADMNKYLANLIDKREALMNGNTENEKTRDAIKSLSDVELRAKVKELLGKTE